MKQIATFAERLKETLASSGLSASELSRRMSFNSRNSVFRVLNNEASYEKQKEFLVRLKKEKILNLTPLEWSQLDEGLEVSRVGIDHYASVKAMDDLVKHSDVNVEDIQFVFHEEGTERSGRIEKYLEPLFASGNSQILIVGCCDLGLFTIMKQLLSKMKGRNASIKIRHYIQAADVELVLAIKAIQPVIYSKFYEAYMLKDSVVSREIKNLYCGNMMLGTYVDAPGSRHFLHFVMSDSGRIHGYEHESEYPYCFLENVLQEHMDKMAPIKASFMRHASPEDYLQYTEKFRGLEENTALFDIKSDVPINYIHPEILRAPITDGFRNVGFGKAEEQKQLVDRFYEIHLKRWNNFFRKNKVTHTIFTYESMRQFAMTGLQSDHFFAMRPYNGNERKEILKFLRDQTANNPFFTVYFFRKEFHPVHNEIGLYDGKGVVFTKSNTNYKLDGEHAEAMIAQNEFCSLFKSYFLKKLLVRDVTSSRETLMILDELIALTDG